MDHQRMPMFKNLSVNIDSVDYDPRTGYTKIIGWGINPVTKNPLHIESDVPALINAVPRVDISDIFGIKRSVPYGFIIQFPGESGLINPVLTFSDGEIEETSSLNAIQNQVKYSFLTKAYKTLVDQGLLKFKKNEAPQEVVQIPRDQPQTPFSAFIEESEERLWNNEPLEPEDIKDISLIVTVKNPQKDLKQMLKSIAAQTVPFEEVLVAAPEGVDLSELEKSYPIYTGKTLSEAVNQAALQSKGEYITFIDNGDQLSEHFVDEVLKSFRDNPETDFLYADSDKITGDGERYDLHFKPAFDDILLRSENYILQPVVLSSALFDRIGGMRSEREGLQNYDLILRATKEAKNIKHIPKILYHWNAVDEKVSKKKELMEEYLLGQQMLEDRYKTLDEEVEFDLTEIDYAYDMIHKIGDEGKVSLIIGVPSGFDNRQANATVQNLLNTIDYPNFEILAVNLDSFDDERVKNIPDLRSQTKAELYNQAVRFAQGDYLAFIEPGFTPTETTWIDELLQYAALDDVGIVGPYFFNNLYRIDQAGVTISDGKRTRLGEGAYCLSNGYDLRLRLPHEVFAIGDECLIIEKDLFKELEGFDTTLLPTEADIDIAIRARKMGKKSVVHPNVSAQLEGNGFKSETKLTGLLERYKENELQDKLENPVIQDLGQEYLRDF